jgi:hypothetical protein
MRCNIFELRMSKMTRLRHGRFKISAAQLEQLNPVSAIARPRQQAGL